MAMTDAEEAAAISNSSASSPDVLVENGVVLGTENETSNRTTNVQLRQGTILSARFNILCTMVGGGCLSLPMAFRKTGNGLVGPCLLILTAALTDACFRMIIGSVRRLSPVSTDETVAGKESYESLANATFGARGHFYTKWLVTAVCFFGAVAYAVLLRDLLQPLTDAIAPHTLDIEASGGPTLSGNITMWIVILLVTPLCGLQNLSSLEKLGL
jgi:amino acid permease